MRLFIIRKDKTLVLDDDEIPLRLQLTAKNLFKEFQCRSIQFES